MLISAEKAPWHYILLNRDWDQSLASCRTVGGRATPVARRARLAAGRGVERRRKRLPSCSTSVSVNELRSATISGQEPPSVASPSAAGLAIAAMRSSSSIAVPRGYKYDRQIGKQGEQTRPIGDFSGQDDEWTAAVRKKRPFADGAANGSIDQKRPSLG